MKTVIVVGFVAVTMLVSGCGTTITNTEGLDSSESLPGRVQLATRPPSEARLPAVCRLSDERQVGGIFGHTSRNERAGPFPGTCSYTFPDAPHLEVIISDLGPAETWRQLRTTASENRGGVVPVFGVGEAAFAPADAEGQEMVVRAGDVIFAVVATTQDYESDLAPKVARLARAAAATLK